MKEPTLISFDVTQETNSEELGNNNTIQITLKSNQLQRVKTFKPPKTTSNVQDNFHGIFDFMRTKYGDEIYNNGVIEVTASSDHDNRYNVLKDDDSYWYSINAKNSWIQFDFKSKLVSLDSYSLRTYTGPRSWRIEGSNDLSVFTLIDQRLNNDDFSKCSSQHYKVNLSDNQIHMRYRFIRITQGHDGSLGYDHNFWLIQVEFFGSLFI